MTAGVPEVARTDAIPVSGGAVFARDGVVITQLAPGVFAAFDATRRHQGCTVRAVVAGTINCFYGWIRLT